jgi:pilus biogenesis lipoprotein CpaD
MFEEPAAYGNTDCEVLAAVHDASQLGCATRHNIAVLAENPSDLMRPRRETPRDAMRRDSVLSGYFQSRAKSAAPASLPAAQTNQASVQQ